MRGYGGVSDETNAASSPNLNSNEGPYQSLSSLSLLPASMLARQMLGGLSLHASLTTSPIYTSNWYRNPTSPPPTPVNKTRRNNNNVVTSSTSVKKPRRRIKISPLEATMVSSVVSSVESIPEPPLSPPTSGSSPQSNGSAQEINSRTSEKDKLFTCGICKRSFGYKHVLQNHERTHTGEKPFECKECHKRFTRDHHLKTHMRLHTGEKPYNCTHCDRKFVQVANLRRHLRVHTGERPYSCDLCSCKFSDSNQLKAHILIHKGEKPFQCMFCNGKFRRRHHLTAHKCPSKSAQDLENLDELNEDSRDTELEIDEDVDSTRSSPINEFEPELSLNKSPEFITTQSTDTYLTSINNNRKMRGRKSRDIRRVIRVPDISGPILDPMSIPPLLPEQTEPEDLSMPKSKLRNQLTQNNNLTNVNNVTNMTNMTNITSRDYLIDSRSLSPPNLSSPNRSPFLEEDKEVLTNFSNLYHHPKFRRHIELNKTSTVS